MMITASSFCNTLASFDLTQYYGVPDSLLKDFCAFVDDHYNADQHIICANEGNAVAMAMGHYMGSNFPAVVYMQNSGLGNAVNPLVSLADPNIYSIPMLLVIGWRGEPGVSDEPQHVMQGQITPSMLDNMQIPYAVLDASSNLEQVLSSLQQTMLEASRPVALLVKKGTFEKYTTVSKLTQTDDDELMSREAALALLLEHFPQDTLFVSTTGKTSREVFEIRTRRQQPHSDFLTVGGMGHASSIALAVAKAQPHRQVVVFDGDGAALMHLGALPIIGHHQANNLMHIVLNNGCHESVGGQPTVARQIDLIAMAKACGYKHAQQVSNPDLILSTLNAMRESNGTQMLEVLVKPGARADLGRPTSTPVQNKQQFMAAVNANPVG